VTFDPAVEIGFTLSEKNRIAIFRAGPALLVGNVALPIGGYMEWTFVVTANTTFSCGVIAEQHMGESGVLYTSAIGCVGLSNNVIGGKMPNARLSGKTIRVCVDDNKAMIFADEVKVFEERLLPNLFPVRLALRCFRSAEIYLLD